MGAIVAVAAVGGVVLPAQAGVGWGDVGASADAWTWNGSKLEDSAFNKGEDASEEVGSGAASATVDDGGYASAYGGWSGDAHASSSTITGALKASVRASTHLRAPSDDELINISAGTSSYSRAAIADTLVVDQDTTARLRARVHGNLSGGWGSSYMDGSEVGHMDFFIGLGTGGGEGVDVVGYEEIYEEETSFYVTETPMPQLDQVWWVDVTVELQAGVTYYFLAELETETHIDSWSYQTHTETIYYGGSASIDFANTVNYTIELDEGVGYTSGSGSLSVNQTIPEPASLGLLAIGSALLAMRRRG